MTSDYDPDGASAGRFDDTRASVDSLDAGVSPYRKHRTWLHRLFSVGGGEHVLLVAAATSALYFVGLYVVSVALGQGQAYLRPSNLLGLSAYATALGVFVVLVILGTWVTSYADILQALEPAVGSDEQSYERLIDYWLGWLYNTPTVVVVFIVFEAPFAFVVNELNPFVPEETVLTLLNMTIVFLATTAVCMFVVHFFVVRGVMRFGLENAFTAARTLEPLARLSINTAVWWFVGVTVLSTYYWLWLSDYLRPLLLQTEGNLVQAPPMLGVVAHAALLGLLITVGFALVAVPTWQMHVGLTRAKKDLLTDVNQHYNQIVHGWMHDRPPADVTGELSAAEKAYESITRIRTWPYDIEGVLKLLVSSIIPVAQFVLTTLPKALGIS